MFHKVREVIRSEGLSGLSRRSIVRAYRRIRRYTPKQSIRYSGIPICYYRRWGDHLVPRTWVHPDELREDQPGYEVALVAGLNEIVAPGDRVVIVGAGLGVTTVVAALRAGPLGTVKCFEASRQYVGLAQKTVARNKAVNVSIHHAVIAKSISIYGSGSDLGPIVSVSQLPSCDVLQLDCEGAEVDILREMTIQPRVILVETHGVRRANRLGRFVATEAWLHSF
jgi:hypothetical protein